MKSSSIFAAEDLSVVYVSHSWFIHSSTDGLSPTDGNWDVSSFGLLQMLSNKNSTE